MSVVYKLVRIEVNGTAIPFSQVGADPEIEQFSESTGSSYYPKFMAIQSKRGALSIQSPAIATVMGLLGTGQLLAVTQADLWYAKLAATGYASGSVHKKLTINDGLLVLRRLGAQQGQAASAELDLFARWDGTNEPFAWTSSVALPSDTALDELYTVGPLKIASTQYETEGLEYSPNWEIFREAHSGLAFPDFLAAMRARPELRVSTLDVALAQAYTNPSAVVEDPVVWFRKVTRNGNRVADATAEHVSLTFPSCMITAGRTTGNWGAQVGTEIMLRPYDNGSDDILTFDTTAAIS